MNSIAQKSREALRDQTRHYVFNWLFDSNRFDKLERIVIAKDELGFTFGEIGQKLGVSKQAVQKHYKQFKEAL